MKVTTNDQQQSRLDRIPAESFREITTLTHLVKSVCSLPGVDRLKTKNVREGEGERERRRKREKNKKKTKQRKTKQKTLEDSSSSACPTGEISDHKRYSVNANTWQSVYLARAGVICEERTSDHTSGHASCHRLVRTVPQSSQHPS